MQQGRAVWWWVFSASAGICAVGLTGLANLGGPPPFHPGAPSERAYGAHAEGAGPGACAAAASDGDEGAAALAAAEQRLRHGDNAGALACAGAVVDRDPRHPTAHRVLAVAHARLGERPFARQHQVLVEHAGMETEPRALTVPPFSASDVDGPARAAAAAVAAPAE
ncbi:MAG: hypothetical protein HY904_08510 [Deltaproteobacteria bacterium]|nr:hypothetical protein [Deltaproteobacteria bacterium]